MCKYSVYWRDREGSKETGDVLTCPAVPLVDVQPRLQEILDGLQVALACCSEELQVRHDNKLSHVSCMSLQSLYMGFL